MQLSGDERAKEMEEEIRKLQQRIGSQDIDAQVAEIVAAAEADASTRDDRIHQLNLQRVEDEMTIQSLQQQLHDDAIRHEEATAALQRQVEILRAQLTTQTEEMEGLLVACDDLEAALHKARADGSSFEKDLQMALSELVTKDRALSEMMAHRTAERLVRDPS